MPRMLCVLIVVVALPVPASELLALELHVAPDGADANPGTEGQPLRTIGGARQRLRTLRAAGRLTENGVTVWLAGGVYAPGQTVVFEARDSGRPGAPVVLRAIEGEEVRIVGWREVHGFRPVSDRSVLDRLPGEAREHVREAKLDGPGLADLGDPVAGGDRLELFIDDEPMTLARWPNEGFVQVRDVVGGAPFTAHGIRGDRKGRFTYDGDRPRRWQGEPDARLHGYWFWDWSDAYEKIRSVDLEKQIIETEPPYHHYGYRKGQRFYALNLLAELDRPGEWYVDREARRLYLWPPSSLENARVVVSVLQDLVALEGCSWLTLRGLTFEGMRRTAIRVESGTGVRVEGCTIRNTGGWGVRIAGGRQSGVIGSTIYRTGEGGVSLSGGDRPRLLPAGHHAVNNHIHHFGRIYRTYRPAVAVGGVGQIVQHNLIHDGPHNAIQLGGNDHLVEFNEIHHVCHETGDVGAFYMGRDWTARGTVIRYNYFHDIRGPGLHGAMSVYLDDAASGIQIVGNLFVDAGRAAFIGGGRDNVVENNIFVRCQPAVHVDARGLGWMRYHVEEGGTLPERLEAMPYREPPWSTRYPALARILEEDPGAPRGNVIRRNVSIGGRWLEVEAAAKPLVTFEDNLVDRDPLFVDAANGDYRLRPSSPALERGFEPIPLERIGPVEDARIDTDGGG